MGGEKEERGRKRGWEWEGVKLEIISNRICPLQSLEAWTVGGERERERERDRERQRETEREREREREREISVLGFVV